MLQRYSSKGNRNVDRSQANNRWEYFENAGQWSVIEGEGRGGSEYDSKTKFMILSIFELN